ncbi:MAG: hypothetical protein JWN95_1355 [Frankiales bacterium]|nr:hypothetical protein [Frankiales bacterium]
MSRRHRNEQENQSGSFVDVANSDWFGGRLWTGVAAIAIVLLLGAATLTTVITHHHTRPPGSSNRAVSSTPVEESSSPSSGSLPAPAPPGPPGADQTALTSAPTGVGWQLQDQVALPTSATAGPRTVTDGVPTGYTDTATGALLAACQTWMRIGSLNPVGQDAVRRALVTGPGRSLLTSQPPTPDATVRPQLTAFRFDDYTPGKALIELVITYTDAVDGNRVMRANLGTWLWRNGSWLLYLDNTEPGIPPVLSDLTGYVPFAGIS